MAQLYGNDILSEPVLTSSESIERKLASDVADTTVSTISDIISTFENPVKREKNSSTYLPKKLLRRLGVSILAAVVLLLALAALVVVATTQFSECAPSCSPPLSFL